MMMLRPSTIVWIVLWVVASFGLYMVKYKVQAVRSEVIQAEHKLKEEKKDIHVLTAEWMFINRPERLQQLAAKYLHMQPMHGKQLADFSTLPYPNAPATPAAKNPASVIPVSTAPIDAGADE